MSESEKPATGSRKFQFKKFEKGGDIAERLLRLGVAVLRIARGMGRELIGRHLAMQLVRSGTSAGANYEEARAAESRIDFAHKVGLAAKEAREAIYWLRLIQEAGLSSEPYEPLIQEANELAAVLLASRRTARANLTPTIT